MDEHQAVARAPEQRRTTPEDQRLADARVRFLTSEQQATQLGEVREAILASWWRSRRFDVPADRIEVPYSDDRDFDAPWIHNAQPLLHQLDEQLDGQPISLILTDPAGAVLSQHTGDSDLYRHLEGVDLVPGFSYGEQFVGTNGIGTALQDERPSHVFGHEHYAENLEDLACAGVPIQHPLSGKTIGAVDLTCWRRDASGLLIALARSAAQQIRQALLTTTSVRELELFQAYLQACRRTGGIVMALNDDVVMMNDYARQLLDAADQTMLLGRAQQALSAEERARAVLELPSGNTVRMHCRRVAGPGTSARVGGVVHVELMEVDSDPGPSGPALPMFLPGTVGSAPLWVRCCHDVDASHEWGEWVALTGEPGVGKHVLAECVHHRRRPGEGLRTLDAAGVADGSAGAAGGWLETVREQLADPNAALLIRHVDRLDAATAEALAATLDEIRGREEPDPPWVAVILAQGSATDPKLGPLLALVPRTVEVPPLRYHIEDLRQLVPFFLNKLCRGGELTCSPEAMKLLMRATWPGNVAELYQLLKHVAQHRRRMGAIQPGDLPAEYHAVTRRALNHLESIERDAIVQALRDSEGNKVRAAKSLGMSRATIYRKIHDYGIVTPERTR